ncbi:hypothetical protein BAUCODRAFT_25142 [Baudoinia panamericana UAMH 10762]|uniref:Uncharacterized protein n=1 Tax=Baudoinia panamericana (strain UAMH 10762) TaxID=717646 RepID=M2MU01_BAUPA|nr:uncharacterized protein BAUCODRAFT_25142 [Baudoinia panamericana UAMH 10762]EMC95013.1 hypothetical protein BAUCODRAFT_25142 [Baudoinia panamericana UAMH 10762]
MSGPMSWRTQSRPLRTPRQSPRDTLSPTPYTQSRTWLSPNYRGSARPTGPARRSNLQLNDARRKLCPNSPFWHRDFDLDLHKSDWKAGELRRKQALLTQKAHEQDLHDRLHDPNTPDRPIRRPLTGILFPTQLSGTLLCNRGSVLGGEETIWCPQYLSYKSDVAPWPSRHEMDYEGDGRLATDRLHRRFLPLPRVDEDAASQQKNWQHRAVVPQAWFDEVYACGPERLDNPLRISWEDVWFRCFWVGEREFEDESGEVDGEGKHAVGEALLAVLDPSDQWV